MTLNSILGFVSLVGWLMVIGGAGIAISNAAQNRSSRPGILLALVGLVVGILFFIASTGLVTVGATEVAVVFQSVGGDPATNSLWPTPLGPGVHIIIPIINTPFIYSTAIQDYTMSKTSNEGAVSGDDSVQVRTSDGQQVYLDVSVLYQVNPLKANLVHVKWQDRYETDFVRPIVRSAVRDVVAGYVVEDLLGPKRTEIQTKIHDAVITQFDATGLTLTGLLLRNITFSDQYIAAVEAKQVAEQQAEQALQDATKVRTLAKGNADAAVLTAQGQADAEVTVAKGDAQAIELRAQADADELGLVNVQLQKNPQLIQWRYIEKLASDVKLVLVPSNSPFLFDLQGLQNSLNSATSGANGTGTAATTVPATPAPTATPAQ